MISGQLEARHEKIEELVRATHEPPFYGQGNPFGGMTNLRMGTVLEQAFAVGDQLAAWGYPEEAIPKATAFAPMLTAGELLGDINTRRLALFGSAICDMYIADQRTDRGDTAMPFAIRRFVGIDEALPEEISTKHFASGMAQLAHMEAAIAEYAGPRNATAVQYCFDRTVLLREAEHFDLSTQYKKLPEAERKGFLDLYARRLGNLMARNAGVQSVALSNYALISRDAPELPSVKKVMADPTVEEAFDVFNVFARIGDEDGDQDMDAGLTDKGEFSINPFKQYHEDMVHELCSIGRITSLATVRKLQATFLSASHGEAGASADVVAIFAAHVNDYLAHPRQRELYDRYPIVVNQAARVLKICDVNQKQGDIRLAGNN